MSYLRKVSRTMFSMYFYRIRNLTHFFIQPRHTYNTKNETIKYRLFSDEEFDEDDDDDMNVNETESLHHMHNVMTAECEQHGMCLNEKFTNFPTLFK